MESSIARLAHNVSFALSLVRGVSEERRAMLASSGNCTMCQYHEAPHDIEVCDECFGSMSAAP